MENIPAPPYPGPPLQPTSHVQQRAYTQHPAPQTNPCIVEARPCNLQQSPGPQHQRSFLRENIPAPPYPGPPLESHPTSYVQNRTFTLQPAPQTHLTTAEDGPYSYQQSHGPQHHGSLPMENIPAPPYPGPPLESQPTSCVQNRTFTPQPAPQTHLTTAEGGPRNHRHFPGPQHQSSLPVENIPAPPYPGPSLEFESNSYFEQRAYTHQPAPHGHCTSAEESPCTHMPSPHPQKLDRPTPKGAYTSKPDPYTQYHNVKGDSCKHSHSQCSPTYHPQHAKHSPAYMEKEKVNPGVFYEPVQKITSQGCMQEKIFAQHDVPHKHCPPGQDANVSYDVRRSAEMPSEKDFCMEKISRSLKSNVSLEQKDFSHVYYTQVESPCSSEKTTTEIGRQTADYVKISTDSVSATASYPGLALSVPAPNPTVQHIIPDTSAPMYSYYNAGAVQPGVQVVHTGGTQYVVQPQRQTVVVPSMASQTIFQPSHAPSAMVIQPANPAVRVIQPAAPAVQVIQPAAPAVKVIQPAAPAVRVIQPAAPAVRIIQQQAPARVIQPAQNAVVYHQYY